MCLSCPCQVDASRASPTVHACTLALAALPAKKGTAKESPEQLDSSAASAAATPPPNPGSRPEDAQPSSQARVNKKTGKRASCAGSALVAKPKGRREDANESSRRRPARASKSRAQEQLKERDYSSDSLMEESEAEEDVEQTGSRAEDVSCAAPSSRRRKTSRVRFSIDSDNVEGDAMDRGELAIAVGGDMSPIAMDSEEVICVGDGIDTDKQDAKREARRRQSLEAVDDQLGELRYEASKSKSRHTPQSMPGRSTDEGDAAGSSTKRRRTSETNAVKEEASGHARRRGRARRGRAWAEKGWVGQGKTG